MGKERGLLVALFFLSKTKATKGHPLSSLSFSLFFLRRFVSNGRYVQSGKPGPVSSVCRGRRLVARRIAWSITILITGGVGSNTGEAAVLDVGGAESTNDFMNGAIDNDGGGNAAESSAATGQGIYQVALALGDEDESTLSSANDLLDETAVLNELETANGESSTDGVVSLGTGNEFSDLDDMAFTIAGPDGSFAVYSYADGDTDSNIDAGELSLVGIGSDGDVSAEFNLA